MALEKNPKSSGYKELSCQAPLSRAFQKNRGLNGSTTEPGPKSVLYAVTEQRKASLPPLTYFHLATPSPHLPPVASIPPWQPLQEASSYTSLSHMAKPHSANSSGLSYKPPLAGSTSQHEVPSRGSPLEEQQSRAPLPPQNLLPCVQPPCMGQSVNGRVPSPQ